jgi:hypothetical protein
MGRVSKEPALILLLFLGGSASAQTTTVLD